MKPEYITIRKSYLGGISQSVHLTGRVILGSILLGVILILAGAVQIIAAKGHVKGSSVRSINESKSSLIISGTAIASVGALLTLLGSLLCAIEAGILQIRGKKTDHETLA